MYIKGLLRVSRDRLKLLELYFRRCEERTKVKLAECMRQQVFDEAAMDLDAHRRMHPSKRRREENEPPSDFGYASECRWQWFLALQTIPIIIRFLDTLEISGTLTSIL